MDYTIVQKYGHVEIHDKYGAFICSGDTVSEAIDEYESSDREWELD